MKPAGLIKPLPTSFRKGGPFSGAHTTKQTKGGDQGPGDPGPRPPVPD